MEKWILATIATFFVLMMVHSAVAMAPSKIQRMPASSRAPAKSYTCKYKSGDVGTIVGHGSNQHEAHADAAEKCFDRRVALFERVRGQDVSMDRGELFIDSCVNLRCQ